MTTETGGQAFPAHFESHDGMTLRDYFAAKAMQRLKWISPDHFAFCAELSYEMADAMLKARQA
jgi:hypothetical protein